MSKAVAELFRTLTHGVYIVGVSHGNQANAFTAASVMLVSYSPPHLALSVNIHHSSYRLLSASAAFAVNVLKHSQLDFAQNYARPASSEKMAFAPWSPGVTGAPLLRDALACFECQVTGELPAGDHALVLGRVIDGKFLDAGEEPLNYRDAATLDEDYAAGLFPDTLG